MSVVSESMITTYLDAGHTEEKHIGMSKRKLRNRIYCTPVSSTTSYSTKDVAQFAIKNIIQNSEKKIRNWISTEESERMVLYGEMCDTLGYGYFRTDDEKIVFKEQLHKACVILKKENDDFQVLTSYLVI